MMPKKTFLTVLSSLLTVGALTMGGAGCASGIGDECTTSAHCIVEDGICDTTAPDGYCTRTPCETGACGKNGVCIEFSNGETFCMATCKSNDDCRSGYRCIRSPISDANYCYVK